MLTTKIRVQVVSFVVIALTVVAFVGANYARLDTLFGGGTYTVRLQLAEGGGVFDGGEVTYRGVAVGRVGQLRLTAGGMEADLNIDEDAPRIPANARAVVANRSAVGEQYVDLLPRTELGPFLEDGSVIAKESTAVPMPVPELLGNVSAFTESVPIDSLRTVVDELDDAFHGTGPDLQVLLDSATEFTDGAADHLPQTTTLINDGTTVLDTQLRSAEQWRSFAGDTRAFARELASADGDLRGLIAAAPEAATQFSGLLADTNPSLSHLLANLLTTADLVSTRIGGIEQLMVLLPKGVATTSAAITPDSANLSLALTFFTPPPCRQGYESTPRRGPEDVNPLPWNVSAQCTLSADDPSLVRGSRNVAQAGVPAPAVPGSGTAMTALNATPLPNVSESVKELLWLPK